MKKNSTKNTKKAGKSPIGFGYIAKPEHHIIF